MPLRSGCSRATESANFRELYAKNARLPPRQRRSRAQITAIVLTNARRTGAGRQCMPAKNPNQHASGRMRPTPAIIGRRYAQEQLESDHFAHWMLDQLHASGPDLIDAPTRENARRIAHNMLVDLRQDTTRNLTDRDVMRQLSMAGARHDATAVREWGGGFRKGIGASLPWLSDEVLHLLQEKHKSNRSRRRR